MKGKNIRNAGSIEAIPGIIRRTLINNDQVMVCHFVLKAGAEIPFHNHQPTQAGYVIKGSVRFASDSKPDGFEVSAGDTYLFDPNENHMAKSLTDSEVIEIFSPSRPEYE